MGDQPMGSMDGKRHRTGGLPGYPDRSHQGLVAGCSKARYVTMLAGLVGWFVGGLSLYSH